MRNSSKNGKVNALRGVMKNENLSKTLEKALKSPLGSTDRVRAQKALSVIRKTAQDGKGGPGVSIPRENVQLRPRSYDYSRLVVFPATPKPRYKFGEKPAVHDGQGGIPSRTSLFESPFSANAASSPLTGAIKNEPQSSQGGLMSTLRNVGSSVLGAFGKTFSNPIANALPVSRPLFTALNFAKGSSRNNSPEPTSSTKGTSLGSTSLSPTSGGASDGGGSSWGGPSDSSTPTQNQYGGAIGPTQQFNNLSETLGGSSSTTPGLSSRFQGVQNAVNQNMGSSMFAYQALNQGGDYLKNIPGFENLSESQLSGGSLTDRLTNMEATLRQNYNLNSLLNSFTDYVNQGVGLQGRLTDYVRGRDEFLNQTDSMLENLKDRSATMDMSDPRNRAAVSDHMNYLYELRGRQNKRYVEFLTSSIDQYNSRLQAMETNYTTALDGYQRELEFKANLTQNEYTMMYTALTGMYEAVQQAPLIQAELEILQAQAYDASRIAANNALGISDVADLDDYVTTHKNMTSVGAISKDGLWNPGMSHALAATNNPANYLGAMMGAVSTSMRYVDGDGMPLSSENMKATVEDAMKWVNTFESSGSLSPQDADSYRNNLVNQYLQGMTSAGYLRVPEGQEITSMVNWLSSNKNASRNKFGAQFGDASELVLDALWNDFLHEPNAFDRGGGFLGLGKTTAPYLMGREGQPLDNDELKSVILNRIRSNINVSNQTVSFAPSNQNMASLGTGNRPQRNNNPGNVKSGGLRAVDELAVGIDDQGHLIFPTPEAGFQALAMDLSAKVNGRSSHVPANPTIAQIGKAYAEDPGWANKVASIIGVTPNTLARSVDFQALTQAVARQEGFFA